MTHPINFGPVFIGFADEIGDLGRTLRPHVVQDFARILVAPHTGGRITSEPSTWWVGPRCDTKSRSTRTWRKPGAGARPRHGQSDPEPRAGEGFPDAPDDAPGAVQDQPDFNDFAARLGLSPETEQDSDTRPEASPTTGSDTSLTKAEPYDSASFADRASGAGARAVGAVARGLGSPSARLSKLNDLPAFSPELIETIAAGVAARTWLSDDRLRPDSRVIAWARPVSPRGDARVDEATTFVKDADLISIQLV